MADVGTIERLMAWLAPRWTARRLAVRAAQRTAGGRRGYAGARPGGTRDTWTATGGSPNSEIGPALVSLRNNVRQLVRDNPYAARAIDVWVAQTIGDGITGRPDGDDDALATRVRTAWQAWAETTECDADGQHDLYGLQALAERARRESGEALIRLRPRLPTDGLTVPLQLQVLEADFLDLGKTGTNGANIIIQGVEFDTIGRRVAYWLYTEHPGDLTLGALPFRSLTSRRVPADRVIHLYQVQRPGQVRGVPDLAPVVTALKDLGDYDEAIRVRAKIDACLAAFVSPAVQDEVTPLGLTTETKDDGTKVEHFEPGMIGYLKPGDQVTIAEPKPSGGHNDYRLAALQSIAAGARITYDQIAGDLRQANYSSLRAGKLDMRRLVSAAQWLTLIPRVCEPIAAAFMRQGELARLWPAGAVMPFAWSPPQADLVDPKKDTEGLILQVRAGLKTPQQAILEMGYDPTSQVEEIAEFLALLDANGVSLDIDPRRGQTAASTTSGDMEDAGDQAAA